VKRYLYGPVWSQNSCAIDCLIFAGNMLDAWRVQLDQVTLSRRRELPLPSQVMRRVSLRKWGNLSIESRGAARDTLRTALHNYDPDKFGPAPNPLPLHSVIDTLLAGLPQCSYTCARVVYCCDDKVRCGAALVPTRRLSITISSLATNDYVSELFQTHQSRQRPTEGCSNVDRCTRTQMSILQVLDRMPPTMIVHLADNLEVTRHRQPSDPFMPLTLSYMDRHRQYTKISYYAQGAIFQAGRGRGSHFFAVWRVDRAFVLYDGMFPKGKVREIQHWWDFANQTARLCTIFYRVHA